MNPLDQLNPLHLPPPPGWWPPAPGWWLLLTLTVAVAAAVTVWLVRLHRARAYRREALVLAAQYNRERDFGALLALVRRTARTTVPDSDWAALDAPRLLIRLDQWSDGRLSRELIGTGSDELAALANRLYRSEPIGLSDNQWQTLATWTRRWIQRHRARDLQREARPC